MGQYSYSQPSSSSADSVKSRDRERDHYGIPRGCWCGGDLQLIPNTTGEFQGRLCYNCNRSEGGGLHLQKFWDKAILEEINDLHRKLNERDDQIDFLTRGPNGTKVYPSMLSAQIEHYGKELVHIRQLVGEIGDGYDELSSILRNITPRASHSANPTTFRVKEVKGFILGFLSVIVLLLIFIIIKQ